MRPELAALAAQQSGLVTRRQAVEAGYSERELRSHLAVGGPWVVVRRGVYVAAGSWEERGTAGQWALRDRAVHLSVGFEHLMSHDSAARALGIPIMAPRTQLNHLVRPGVWGSRTEHGVKHHLARTMPAATEVDGLRVVDRARTALDLAREHGFVTGVAAADHVLRAGVTPEQLRAELDAITCWPHATRARAAVEHADPGAEDGGETFARLLVRELGRGAPQTQFPLQTSRGLVWVDLILGRHVFEFDGQVKYRPADRGGVAHRPPEQVVWDEKLRERAISSLHLGVSRIVFADFWGEQRTQALARLGEDVAATEERFGMVLPGDLVEFADRMTAARARRLRAC